MSAAGSISVVQVRDGWYDGCRCRQVGSVCPGEVSVERERAVILIIEDDYYLRTGLRRVLEGAGYEVVESTDGQAGLAAFAARRPDLVLTDLMMPGMNGFDTCARLREIPDADFVPVLVVTALDDRESIDRAFQMGVTDYITKPVNPDVLRLRVRRLLDGASAEKRILRAKQEWEATFDAVSEMVLLTDEEHRILRCNRATIDRLHTTFHDLLGKRLDDVFPSLVEMTPGGETAARLGEFHLDGQPGMFEGSVYPLVLHGGGSGMVYVIQDVTERRAMQARLIASQKLADLGTLAAGVAHEINSPLQVITGVSQSLLDRQRDGRLDADHLARNLEVIHRNGWRCAEIVRSLRTYAYASASEVASHSLNELVKDTLLLIENQVEKMSNISVRTELGQDVPIVACGRNQMAQVLINLLTNAQDAMPDGGEITIATRYEPDEDWVVLEVADNGSGIPPEILPRVFDPFFTTKPVGEGTGLGLSIVDGIVRAHGGEILVDSRERMGTTFSIRLPGAVRSGLEARAAPGGRYSR